MPYITPDDEEIKKQYLKSHALLFEALFDRDVILLAGSTVADNVKFSETEREKFFFVQLNHHIKRRSHQPCDWLIARAGSKIGIDAFNQLPENQRSRIKVISCAANKLTFTEFASAGLNVFPFQEDAHRQNIGCCLAWCNQFWHEIKTNPLIGIMAIKMILMFPVKSLTLIGFDFFEMPSKAQRKTIGCHDLEMQRAWLREQYRTDYRLIIDDKLKKILNITDNQRGIIPPYFVEEIDEVEAWENNVVNVPD